LSMAPVVDEEELEELDEELEDDEELEEELEELVEEVVVVVVIQLSILKEPVQLMLALVMVLLTPAHCRPGMVPL